MIESLVFGLTTAFLVLYGALAGAAVFLALIFIIKFLWGQLTND